MFETELTVDRLASMMPVAYLQRTGPDELSSNAGIRKPWPLHR